MAPLSNNSIGLSSPSKQDTRTRTDRDQPLGQGSCTAPATSTSRAMEEDLEMPHWQGAEARIYIREFHGQRAIYKQRFAKAYRHLDLDARLNSSRIKKETNCLEKANKAGIRVPRVFQSSPRESLIVMEYIEGPPVKQAINEGKVDIEALARMVGMAIGRLHAADIVHGDLTTSNMLLSKEGDADTLVLIDFGLAYVTTSIEDQAVDLYVLDRAIGSTHPTAHQELFSSILKHYKSSFPASDSILSRLKEVQARGRKRDMTG